MNFFKAWTRKLFQTNHNTARSQGALCGGGGISLLLLLGVDMEPLDEKEKTDRRFSLCYIGWSSLDRRTTLPMLPWLVAEIRRRSERGDCGPVMQPREVQLVLHPPFVRCVPSNSSNSSVFIFEHKAQLVSRFIHSNSNDLTYFAYLLRGQPDNPESEMSCHVFKACDPNQV